MKAVVADPSFVGLKAHINLRYFIRKTKNKDIKFGMKINT